MPTGAKTARSRASVRASGGNFGARSGRVRQNSGCDARDGDGRGGGRPDRLLRLPDPARHRGPDDAALHRPDLRGFLGHHPRPGAAGDPLSDPQRRRDHPGAQGHGHPPAHEACRKRPAQGRRRRLRDFRQVGRARRHQLRAEHQSSARAGRRTGPHHPLDRPGGGRARASGAAGAAAVLPRAAGAVRLDRAASCAARWRRSRCAPSAIWRRPRSTA